MKFVEGIKANQNLVPMLFPQPKVPNLPWYLWERKLFLLSKMMNLRPRNTQKWETAVVPKTNLNNLKHKPWSNLGTFNLIKKCLRRKIVVMIDRSQVKPRVTNNSKIGPRIHDWMIYVQCRHLFLAFLLFPASIPSVRERTRILR